MQILPYMKETAVFWCQILWGLFVDISLPTYFESYCLIFFNPFFHEYWKFQLFVSSMEIQPTLFIIFVNVREKSWPQAT